MVKLERSRVSSTVQEECPGNAPRGSPSRLDGANQPVADGDNFYPF